MSAIAIYMEGGGDSPDGKAALRRGMDAFLGRLKQAARQRGWNWKLVVCGGREQAKDAFLHARGIRPETYCYLLVDAEAGVTTGPAAHLAKRDGWTLAGVGDDAIHLMVQVMETWLVADPDALSAYYGQSFRPQALPPAADLENVSKADVAAALEKATRGNGKGGKGEHHKIRHASDLLERVNPDTVQARCAHCRRLFDILGTRLTQA